jgi:hypothetical protein
VGGSGSGGDPANRVTHGNSWWSCRLAGSDQEYSPQAHSGGFQSFPFRKCEDHACQHTGGNNPCN